MKNKLKHLFCALILCLMLPISFFLTACGATPMNEVKGVSFNTLNYDETGCPVFEVDKGVETPLSYSVYPSTCSGYKVYFDPIDKGTAENQSKFYFENGMVKVSAGDFQPVKYRVRVKNYSDTCIIKLKEYPETIETTTPEVTISAYESFAINVRAKFINAGGVVSYKNITEKDYNFLVEVEDETIIAVPNKNRLKFYSLRNTTASTKVKVTLLNQANKSTGMFFEINVNIVQNAKDAVLMMSDYGKFIENGDSVELNVNSAYFNELPKTLTFKMFVANTRNVLIESDIEFTIKLSNKKFVSVCEDNESISLSNEVVDGYEFDAYLYSKLTKSDGSLFSMKISFKINVE